MGKVKLFIFQNDEVFDEIERNFELNDEQIHVGMSTFDMLLPPAFSNTFGTSIRLYDKNNPYALIKIKDKEDMEHYKIELSERGYNQKEITEMISLLEQNQTIKRLSNDTINDLKLNGYKAVYQGFKIKMFKKMQFEKWYNQIFVHSPELNHTLFNNTHGKNTFGTTESKREAFFLFGGLLFGIILILAICLPIITYLGAQI